MAETTHISWSDATWNPVIGCTKVSPACDFCYAENLMANRHKRVVWGKPGQRGTLSRTSAQNWNEPIRWNKKAMAAGSRPFVFCSSLSDVFDKNWQSGWRAEAFEVMRRTPALVYLLLTKRPQNIIDMVSECGGLPPNVALGTTIEDQIRADLNVPHLCEAKMELNPLFTFVSCEPLLSQIYLRSIRVKPGQHSFMDGPHDHFDALHPLAPWQIDWIITGGETNQGSHKARHTPDEAFVFLKEQARAAGVVFHQKQITRAGRPIPMADWPIDLRIQERPEVPAI